MSRLVTQIRVLIPTAVPFSFNRIDRIKWFIHGGIELNIIKNEKFRFRPKVGSISDTGGLEVGFRFLGYVAWIATIFFLGDRVHNITDHANRWVFHKRVHNRGGRIGNDQHVTGVNGLPSTDAGAIKPQAFIKQGLFQFTDGHRKMLPGSKKIHELQIYNSSIIFFWEIYCLFGGH